MEQMQLSAEKRKVTGKQVRHLRKNGIIPAVVFGHAMEPVAIQVVEKELRAVLAIAGTTRLISLNIGGLDKPTVALAREIQRNSLTAAFEHIDFQAVVMTEKIRTEVNLIFKNTSPAVTDGTGTLIYNLDTVEVECLPADLISSIEIDLSALQAVDDTVHVKDLLVPPQVKVLSSPDEMVVRVIHITEIKEEAVAETTTAEVEVIKKSKTEEEV